MKLTVIAVGKLKEKYLKEGINEYSKRLSRFCELEIIEVNDEQAPDSLSSMQEEQAKKKEAERVIKRLKPGTVLIILDVRGVKVSSPDLANKLNSYFISGKSHITFVIGGSLGIDKELLGMADLRLSLSDMTFPHQLTRLILLEQVFRAFKIINGETYHK
ncbi:MAG: 23S rRNA (pseudouridine(1915)-N(3))-methyltransferase RlmH [Clostridium sp.]|jgi:23S rRNA (pseudouridine1915-N3)-methyltransferase|nr:23S rRNA (pseudouridine(1915)-N(3))-methyltransferase RlmH [Clostridium sp.]